MKYLKPKLGLRFSQRKIASKSRVGSGRRLAKTKNIPARSSISSSLLGFCNEFHYFVAAISVTNLKSLNIEINTLLYRAKNVFMVVIFMAGTYYVNFPLQLSLNKAINTGQKKGFRFLLFQVLGLP